MAHEVVEADRAGAQDPVLERIEPRVGERI